MNADNRYRPRKIPRQSRSKATYTAILQAAAQVLPELGYAMTTTNKIANRAGVSIGSLYEYFSGKDAIFAALRYDLHKHKVNHIADHLMQVEDQPMSEIIRIIVTSRIAISLERPELELVLQEEIPASIFREEKRNNYAAFTESLGKLAKRHKHEIRLKNIEIAADLCTRMLELIITNTAMTEPERLEDPAFKNELIDMLQRYILK